jgi:hypothetical protein
VKSAGQAALSGGAEWKLREDGKRSSTFSEMLAERLERTNWIAASTLKNPSVPGCMVDWQKRCYTRSLPRLSKHTRNRCGDSLLVPDNTGVVGFTREKLYLFLTRQPGRLPTFPKHPSLSGHHPATKRVPPAGKPHLICTRESGGHLTAHRSDPVAQCLGLSPPRPRSHGSPVRLLRVRLSKGTGLV